MPVQDMRVQNGLIAWLRVLLSERWRKSLRDFLCETAQDSTLMLAWGP